MLEEVGIAGLKSEKVKGLIAEGKKDMNKDLTTDRGTQRLLEWTLKGSGIQRWLKQS